MEPPVSCDLSPPPFRESRASGHSESLSPSAFVHVRIQQRKGTKRIKENEHLTPLAATVHVSDSNVCTHTPHLPHLHISIPPQPTTPILYSHAPPAVLILFSSPDPGSLHSHQ